MLAGALRRVADETFNAITVDGECSTNDCVFLLASGHSGVRVTRDDDPALLEGLRAVAAISRVKSCVAARVRPSS